MGVQWPLALVSLLVLPLLVAAYVWHNRRRRKQAVRHSSVALIRAAAPRRAGWKRHLPFALVLAALGLLGLAAARPEVAMDVPISDSTIILALDVSGSMCSTDVDPNRLTAATTAVREFVQNQDDETRIGLVVFSGFAQLTVAPTTERDALMRSLDGLTTGRGTAIGAAMLKSVDAIAEIDPEVAPSDPGTGTDPAAAPRARPPGTYAPEIVVLLTDGANTTGVEPIDAAKTAAQRGVRVYPIGFGTRNPATMVCSAAAASRATAAPTRRRCRVAAATAGPAPAATSSPTRERCARSPTSPAASTSPPVTPGASRTCSGTSRAPSPPSSATSR